MNLVELALTTYTESKAAEADAAGDHLEQEKADFIELARACAGSTLSKDAGELDWRYTNGLPETIQEAHALVAPGRLEYLRYRAYYSDKDDTSFAFELVQPCLACGVDRVDAVGNLFRLGQLLSESEDDDHTPADDSDGEAAPAPLAPIDALQVRAARMTRLARRLADEHPDAGLKVRYATVAGFEDGGRGELQLRAASAEAAASVATALGAEMVTEIRSSIPPYVFRRGDVTVAVDGIEVQLSGHTQLTDEEAAAWHAEQDQAADGGEA
ncbi:hypothetical protein JHN63_02105 [Streptomyces sp. MBT65]|uniref:hypothetical protein n=1 Tax=Streptomyces sp. MBT65 TaxID=1488395 RepID=UPI0019090960|nr:hypothetical protein [Streptomyces sp. MBT65]MBK3572635.1 hypothetical protein [Streptomyces sp. MBT65]